MRAGFRMILEAEPDIEVVGEAADGREALHARAAAPDVVLMDIRMPGSTGSRRPARIVGAAPTRRAC